MKQIILVFLQEVWITMKYIESEGSLTQLASDEQLERLPIWDSPNCMFIVSSNVQVQKPNVFSIPKDYIESQNYIAAADLVISKSGLGIVSEAICAHKPLLIIDRQIMKEDQNTISYLKEKSFVQDNYMERITQLCH